MHFRRFTLLLALFVAGTPTSVTDSVSLPHEADSAIGLYAVAEEDPSDEQADRLRVQSFRELVVSRLRDEEIRRRHPTAYDKNHASMWLITQADLLFVVMEYYRVEVDERLDAMAAIEEVVISSMSKWNAHIYAVARVLVNARQWLQNGIPLMPWLSLLHQELRAAGESLQVTDSSWMRLLDGLWKLGLGTQHNQFYFDLVNMLPRKRQALTELVSKAASVLEELNVRAGSPVNDFFIVDPGNLLRLLMNDNDSPVDRIQLCTSWINLIESDVEKDKVLRRATMFARWSHLTPVREWYRQAFHNAIYHGDAFDGFRVSADLSVIDWWTEVDAFIEAVSLGQEPVPLSRSITARFTQIRTAVGTWTDLGILLTELTSPQSVGTYPMTRLDQALDKLSRRDPRLSDLMRAGIDNLETELPAHALRSLVHVIEVPLPQGVLSLAYHFGLYTGGKLLANAELASRALDGISEERLKKFRVIVSSWLNFSIDLTWRSRLATPWETYIVSPDRTEEEVDSFVSAMRLLATASKDFEARPDAIFEFPVFSVLHSGAHVPHSLEKLNTLLPLVILNRYNLRILPEIQEQHRSANSVMALFEPILTETSRVYRTSLWPVVVGKIAAFFPPESRSDSSGQIGDLIAGLPYYIAKFYVNHFPLDPESGAIASAGIAITTDILASLDLFPEAVDPARAQEFLRIVLEFSEMFRFLNREKLIHTLPRISERIKALRANLL